MSAVKTPGLLGFFLHMWFFNEYTCIPTSMYTRMCIWSVHQLNIIRHIGVLRKVSPVICVYIYSHAFVLFRPNQTPDFFRDHLIDCYAENSWIKWHVVLSDLSAWKPKAGGSLHNLTALGSLDQSWSGNELTTKGDFVHMSMLRWMETNEALHFKKEFCSHYCKHN